MVSGLVMKICVYAFKVKVRLRKLFDLMFSVLVRNVILVLVRIRRRRVIFVITRVRLD